MSAFVAKSVREIRKDEEEAIASPRSHILGGANRLLRFGWLDRRAGVTHEIILRVHNRSTFEQQVDNHDVSLGGRLMKGRVTRLHGLVVFSRWPRLTVSRTNLLCMARRLLAD